MSLRIFFLQFCQFFVNVSLHFVANLVCEQKICEQTLFASKADAIEENQQPINDGDVILLHNKPLIR